MILISNDFWHKIKMYNCDPYTVLLAIAAAYDCVCAPGTQMCAGMAIFLDLWLLCVLSPAVISQEIPDVVVGLVLSN